MPIIRQVGASIGNSRPERYSALFIRSFRRFDYLQLELAPVNLFFGRNNSGKTSILEAVFAHACGLNLAPFYGQVVLRRQDQLTGPLDFGEKVMSVFNRRRGLPMTFEIAATLSGDDTRHVLTAAFHPSSNLAVLDPRAFGEPHITPGPAHRPDLVVTSTGTEGVIELASAAPPRPATSLGKWTNTLDGETSDHELEFPPTSIPIQSPFKLASFQDVLSHRSLVAEIQVFGSLKRYGILDDFTVEIRKAFPQIKRFDNIPYPDGSMSPIYVFDAWDKSLPLHAFGDGVRRWFYLVGQMAVYQGAVHCVEEIEGALHPSAQPELSRLLIEYSRRYKNQLFLTSHSIEFLDAFLESLYGPESSSKTPNDWVKIFTLKPSEETDDLDVWSFTGLEAYEKRKKFELELR